MTIEQEVKSALIWKGRDNDPEIDFPREIYDAKLVLDLLIKYNSQISNESEIDGWIDENWDFDTLSHKIKRYESRGRSDRYAKKFRRIQETDPHYLVASDHSNLYVFSDNSERFLEDLNNFFRGNLSIIGEFNPDDEMNPYWLRVFSQMQNKDREVLLKRLEDDLRLPSDKRKLFCSPKGHPRLYFGISKYFDINATGSFVLYHVSEMSEKHIRDVNGDYAHFCSGSKMPFQDVASYAQFHFDHQFNEEDDLNIVAPSLQQSLEAVLYFRERGHFAVFDHEVGRYFTFV